MTEGNDRLFARCIAGRRNFHIDPYGGMTFCSFLKDPSMRYDLRKGTVLEAWETFIPSLADKVYGGAEYVKHCAVCDKRKDCRWCPVYGWLEHGRFSAPVEHLCDVAGANKCFKQDWQANHRRYFQIAGITIQVDSDLPINDQTFHPKFAAFRNHLIPHKNWYFVVNWKAACTKLRWAFARKISVAAYFPTALCGAANRGILKRTGNEVSHGN